MDMLLYGKTGAKTESGVPRITYHFSAAGSDWRSGKTGYGMGAFLVALAARFPEATYEQLNSGTIRVRYTRCACDLVKCGLVKSSLICECSAYNLQENFERAWGIPVSVTRETSILQGAPQCVFLVSLESPLE